MFVSLLFKSEVAFFFHVSERKSDLTLRKGTMYSEDRLQRELKCQGTKSVFHFCSMLEFRCPPSCVRRRFRPAGRVQPREKRAF